MNTGKKHSSIRGAVSGERYKPEQRVPLLLRRAQPNSGTFDIPSLYSALASQNVVVIRKVNVIYICDYII
jgi:hypothetical protein